MDHGGELGVHTLDVAELEAAVQPSMTGYESHLVIAPIHRQAKHLPGVGQPYLDLIGNKCRQVPPMERDKECLLIVQAPGHLDGLI
jgi:hypothetical protein